MVVRCDFCGNTFIRSNRRYNEAIKNKWRQFCSRECQNRAKERRVEFICSWKECNKKCTRIISEAKKSERLFCSILCSAKYYGLKSHINHVHKCKFEGCNKSVLHKDNRKKYCSPECLEGYQKLSAYTAESVINSIREFYLHNGKIPLKYEMGALYAPARQHFDTWNNAIEAAGYNPNPVMFAKHYLAMDGHKCDSIAEKIVDDWLYKNGVEHQVHVPYPRHNGMKCDFLIGDTWIEIFGLEGNLTRYDVLKQEKLKLISQYRLYLLPLTLKDAYSRKKLEAKLETITLS